MLLKLFVLSLVVAFASADCRNGIMAGTLTINGTATTNIAQSGGTAYGGITVSGSDLTLKHNTRAYFAQTCDSSFQPNTFQPIYLLDRTLSYTVNLNQVGCGCNAALYLVSMPAYNAQQQPDPTECKDYYCDANHVCGIYCPEMDVMEANNHALQITPHRCNAPNGKYYSYCDGGGCGQNIVRIDAQAYGYGSQYKINTQNPFQVSMSFQTSGGSLSRIVTTLSQGSNSHQIVHDDGRCGSGYLGAMTDAFRNGMVMTFSYWGSSGSTMSWLDIPPCNVNEACDTNTVVSFSNIRVN
eukprot:TRINITY_DN5538_c0_g1_i1.p1 TRINITY_DN5538_c0_g1~~TRINITY_DN5538_c0_g1_i1.p1  ORF type:complete len:297 (-),score=37.42 TRINITY_DN5538_c0_g1_i1:23-913(-)